MLRNVLMLMLLSAGLFGQTLNTPTTMGKGKLGLFVGPNAVLAEGAPRGAFSYGCLVYGATERLDLYGCATHTTLLGQTQFTTTPGFNLNLLKSRTVNLSAFQLLNVPVNRRTDGSETYFGAILAGRDFRLGAATLSPYVGFSSTVPLGNPDGKLFSSPVPVLNVPVGLAVPVGRFLLLVEYGFPVRFEGTSTKTVGIGMAYTIR